MVTSDIPDLSVTAWVGMRPDTRPGLGTNTGRAVVTVTLEPTAKAITAGIIRAASTEKSIITAIIE